MYKYDLLLSVALILFFANADEDAHLFNVDGLRKFVQELPDMPRIKGYNSSPGHFGPAMLTIGMYQISWSFHPDLPNSAVYAYGQTEKQATVPGPTIEAIRGIETKVKWENHLPKNHIFTIDKTLDIARPKRGVATVVHLHGSLSEPESDGSASAWFTGMFEEKGPSWTKEVYSYSNIQGPGILWYHDHAMGLTRANILAGLSGLYVVRDFGAENALNLPSGPSYDKLLLLCDKSFYKNGSIFLPSVGNNPNIHPQWNPEYFGEMIIVNGKAWPFLKVWRRKYRFRLVNGSNARFYKLALSNGLVMTQIGSDAYYLPHIVRKKHILLAPSETTDFIINFADCIEQEIILTNSASYQSPSPKGDPVNNHNGIVMKFILDRKALNDPSTVPRVLLPIQKLKAEDVVVSRVITMNEYKSSIGEPTHLLLNGLTFGDPTTETPKLGSTELWSIINLTEDNHPLHMHLVGFQVISEQKLDHVDEMKGCLQGNSSKCNPQNWVKGESKQAPKSERGWKNVYKMKPSYLTSFLVRFANFDGKPFPFNASSEPGYVYHCHILDHEDNQMMRPYTILP